MHGEWTIQVKFRPELKYLLVNKERHTNLTKMEGYVKDANAVSVQVTLVTERDGRES